MLSLAFLPGLFFGFLFGGMTTYREPDPCEKIKEPAAAITLFTKDSLYKAALTNIKNASVDGNEHCISFGKDTDGNISLSAIAGGSATSGKVPFIANAFTDLHNHTNNMPPDAGDLYGLININTNNPAYKTRFVITNNGSLYALLVTDAEAARAFPLKHPPQPPAYNGGPPGFPVAIVDEAREMKYMQHCTDEMVVAFILEKYNTSVSLLKQDSNGDFKKIITIVSNNGGQVVFSAGSCQ